MLLGGEYPLRSTGYPLNPPVATAHSLGNFMRSQPASRPADQMQPQLLASTTLLGRSQAFMGRFITLTHKNEENEVIRYASRPLVILKQSL
jgi:hypothetical protein